VLLTARFGSERRDVPVLDLPLPRPT